MKKLFITISLGLLMTVGISGCATDPGASTARSKYSNDYLTRYDQDLFIRNYYGRSRYGSSRSYRGYRGGYRGYRSHGFGHSRYSHGAYSGYSSRYGYYNYRRGSRY